jgi:hypothetical protein
VQRDDGVGPAAGVLEDVGQPLLDDAVDRQALAGRERRRAALLGELDSQPGVARAIDQRAQLACSGRRLARRFAEGADRPARLGERLPRGGGDRLERPGGGGRIAARGVPAAVGLGDDDRQRVTDNIVQLAGDPLALARGGQQRPVLELGGALAQRDPAVVAEHGSEEQVDGEHRYHDDPVLAGELVEVQSERDRPGDRDRDARGGHAPRRVGDERVEREQRRRVCGEEPIGEHELGAAGEHHRGEHRDRRAAAQGERRDEQDRRHDLPGGRSRVLAEQRREKQRQQADRDCRVRHHGVPREPPVPLRQHPARIRLRSPADECHA